MGDRPQQPDGHFTGVGFGAEGAGQQVGAARGDPDAVDFGMEDQPQARGRALDAYLAVQRAHEVEAAGQRAGESVERGEVRQTFRMAQELFGGEAAAAHDGQRGPSGGGGDTLRVGPAAGEPWAAGGVVQGP